ncbi:MAG: hypothetical protein RIS79_1125 [Verrucomicrobiota bacterium]
MSPDIAAYGTNRVTTTGLRSSSSTSNPTRKVSTTSPPIPRKHPASGGCEPFWPSGLTPRTIKVPQKIPPPIRRSRKSHKDKRQTCSKVWQKPLQKPEEARWHFTMTRAHPRLSDPLLKTGLLPLCLSYNYDANSKLRRHAQGSGAHGVDFMLASGDSCLFCPEEGR